MKRGFIFDLDGTVYVDNKLIDGAKEAIHALKQRGDEVVFLTNKSIETISAYVEKLCHLGIHVTEKSVVSSNYLVARYLKKKMGKEEKAMVVGEAPLVEELQHAGISLTTNSFEADYVVIGWDRAFTYEKLNDAFQAWRNGAKIVATNPDRTCPVNNGQIPDCGAMIGALEGATGEKIELILGKPSQLAAKFIAEEILRLPPERCYMVGDRLETDIKMGLDYGMNAVLVLSGITDKHMVEASVYKPTFILDSIRYISDLPLKGPDSTASDYQTI
ncbi:MULTISPECIES: HAD-IIA family hydrolase [unclassified Virgibacillus]|uniref:HAD-IIA family hydrolase n=1 Tax=unclassified Virgibacillus TaxID=2620237 RepID=UPI0024DE5786|nr:HAD-IIA family hydrolase [Virgibacillus sp. LDC-1]